MTTRAGSLPKAHRLLAPRVAYLVGTRSSDGEPNLIPISNLTSISTDPQLVVLAVHRAWQTYDNLQSGLGFTVSVPFTEQREGVWKLGARYSRYTFASRRDKLAQCGLRLDLSPDLYGPVLSEGIGWLMCRTVARPDFGGDHGVFVGEVARVEFDGDLFDDDGTPTRDLHPLMQVTGNVFTTSDHTSSLPFGHE